MLSPDLRNIVALMSDCPVPWAVCGGWAIDLFVGRASREHKDIDIAIFRRDQQVVYDFLSERGWRLQVASQGQLTPWPAGEIVQLPDHVIWCDNPGFVPGFLELLLNERTVTHFLFRRNPAIQLELERAFITSSSGVPILAPEIALLYKSKAIDVEGNAADFENVLPHLSVAQRDWLRQALRVQYDSHSWLAAIEAQENPVSPFPPESGCQPGQSGG